MFSTTRGCANESNEVLGPTLTLDKLRRAIATHCLDRLARPWDEMVQLLVAYQKQHRHPRVSKSDTAHGPRFVSQWNVPIVRLVANSGLQNSITSDTTLSVDVTGHFHGATHA